MVIKAISLHQPWATLVAIGAKRIETRSWQTPYRGLLAIHATQDLPKAAAQLCDLSPFREALQAAGFGRAADLPRGRVLAICRLVGCEGVAEAPEGAEGAFGDFRPGRYAWTLDDVWALPEPLPARGSQTLWSCELPDQLLQARADGLNRPAFGQATGYA